MSTRRTPVAAFVCAALVWTASPGVASADTDVAWIGQIRGLTVTTHKATSTEVKTVYALSGSVDAAMDEVTKGLTERGWTIVKGTNTPVAGIASRTLQARKDGALLKLSAQDVMGISQLIVNLSGGTPAAAAASAPTAAPVPAAAPAAPVAAPAPAAAPAAAPAPARPAEPAPAARAGSPGQPLAFGENRIEGTFDCEDRDVVVAGDRCEITLRGACRSLKVMGNANRIRVDASVQSIQALGERNRVTWSVEKNARRPKIAVLGNGNRVRSDRD